MKNRNIIEVERFKDRPARYMPLSFNMVEPPARERWNLNIEFIIREQEESARKDDWVRKSLARRNGPGIMSLIRYALCRHSWVSYYLEDRSLNRERAIICRKCKTCILTK